MEPVFAIISMWMMSLTEWFETHRAQVLSAAISYYCYIGVRTLPKFFDFQYRISYSKIETVQSVSDIQHPVVRKLLIDYQYEHPLELFCYADLPARSGIASSSAFTCSLLTAVNKLRDTELSKRELAMEAIRVERDVVGDSVGFQDQVACAYGGVNRIEFNRSGFSVDPLSVSQELEIDLFQNLFLVYSGQSRLSTYLAKTHVESIQRNERYIERMVGQVDDALSILHSQHFDAVAFGELLREAWAQKKELTSSISNEFLDNLYSYGLDNGALGGKVVGAGGGGFVLFFVDRKHRKSFVEAFREYVVVPVRPDYEGCTFTSF